MSIRLGDTNPLNPLIAAATSVEENIVHDITSIPSYLGCSATSDSIASNACADDDPCCKFLEKTLIFLLSFAGWYYFVSDCVSDFFSDLFGCFSGGLIERAEGQIDQRAKEATRHLWVNRSRLHEAPAPIDVHFQALSQEEENIPIAELTDLCRQIFKNDVFNSPADSVRQYVDHLTCDYHLRSDGQSYFGSNMRNENLQKIAHMLIIELRKKDIPLEKKQHALSEIGDAATHCPPRIYEESQRQWKLLTNQIVDLDEKLKLWLQMLKEDIIISRYQGSQFHVLNHARRALPDWGLDQSPVNFEDRYIHIASLCTSGINYRYTLNREYTPERIVSLIRDKIIDEGDNTQINTYFQDHQDELRTAGLSHQDLFEVDGKSISHKGAAWLLKMHNFLY